MAIEDDSGIPLTAKHSAKFWAKVLRSGPDDCWPWIGLRDRDGYGRIKVGGKDRRSNRVAYMIQHGHSPAVVRHTCDNPGCCNPAHLTPGTQALNMRDRNVRGRTASGTRNGRAKLTPNEVIEIRASAARNSFLAQVYGVAPATIRNIRIGKIWANV